MQQESAPTNEVTEGGESFSLVCLIIKTKLSVCSFRKVKKRSSNLRSRASGSSDDDTTVVRAAKEEKKINSFSVSFHILGSIAAQLFRPDKTCQGKASREGGDLRGFP